MLLTNRISLCTLCAVFLTLGLVACGGSGKTTPPNPAPVISSFAASPANVATGSSTTLSWTVTNATSIQISPGVGDVSGKTSVQVSPSQTTTYTITATNAVGPTTKTVTVTVGDIPAISSFTASPASVANGASTTLSWTITGTTTSLQIDHSVGVVTGTTSVQISPTQTTTYTLTATNQFGTATKTVTVTVGAVPTISSFTATPSSVLAGGQALLAWTVTGATSLQIDSGVGDVTGKTSIQVTPAAATTYTLTATNDFGSATKTVTVTIGSVPTISSFTTSTEFVTPGTRTTLNWDVTGADSLDVNGTTVTGTSTEVSPMNTTTYTLTATNALGTASKTVTITVGFPPTITTFEAVPPTLDPGESATLYWSGTAADSVQISDGTTMVDVTGMTSYKVTPAATTTYSISATNKFGTSLSVPVTVTVTSGSAPTISVLNATPSSISPSDPVAPGTTSTISWSVTGATSLRLTGGGLDVDVTGKTEYLVTPAATTTYTLKATNANGASELSVVVTVAIPD